MTKRRLEPAVFASTTWLIDPGVGELLLAGLVANDWQVEVPEEPVVYEYQYGYYPKAEFPNSVAVVSFTGVIWATWAVDYTMEQLRRIAADPNIIAVVLKINSPGGSADAGEKFARFLQGYPLTVIALVDYGMACSAGYMIAAGCRQILASRPGDRIGSIGTYIPYTDLSGMYEKMGIKQTDIYARQSTEKNEEARAAKRGNFKPLEDYATEVCADFIDYVKERRAETLVEVKGMDPFKGRVFNATDSQAIGLINGIGSLEQAVKLARTLAATNESTNQSTDTDMIAGYVKLASLNAIVGVAADAVTEEQANAITAELTKNGFNVVAARAADLDAANSAQATITRLQTELQTEKTNNSTLTTENNRLQGEVTRLGAQPGAQPTEITAAADPVVQGDGNDWQAVLAGLEHNQNADKNFPFN